MLGRPRKIPAYCRHKASGQAVVRIDFKDEYLGRYGTPESYEKYYRLIAERFPNGIQPEKSPPGPQISHTSWESVTAVELVAAYWEYVKTYYVKDGKPTSEQTSIRIALRPLKELYGHEFCRHFGPLALEAVRKKMIDDGITRKRINQHVGRIRRMFKWGVSRELVPVATYQSLLTVEGLRKGRTVARESEPVRPVPWAHVEATLPYLSHQLQAMVRLQLVVACRPGEVMLIRPCDIDRTADPWVYTPSSHKTEHHDRVRMIPIGAEGQKILWPWLDRAPESYCFSPREARESFDAERRRNRKTPHTPSSLRRERKANPKRKPGERYTTCAYDDAIARACLKAGVPHWHPNQLRHSRATEIRKKYGLEGSQVVLGHSTANVTQIYAERDFELAKQIMSEIG